MPTIRVSKQTLEALTKLKGRLMEQRRKEVAFEDVILWLLEEAGKAHE
jgi:hypothetical protein